MVKGRLDDGGWHVAVAVVVSRSEIGLEGVHSGGNSRKGSIV